MALNTSAATIVYPRISDPRLMQIGILTVFTMLGKTVLEFRVSWLQIYAAVLSVCVLDVLVVFLRTGAVVVPASGFISGLSLGLLVRAPSVWPFLLAGIATVLGKQIIRIRGTHVFNPSNLGLLSVLALPWAHAHTTPAQWGSSWVTLFLVLNFGLFIIYKIRRLHLVAAVLSGFVVFGLLRSLLGFGTLNGVYGSVLSGSLLLFAFFMITDPQTSPTTTRARVVFGVGVAGLDAILRIFGVPTSIFLALFASCAVYGAFRALNGSTPSNIWDVGTLAIPDAAQAEGGVNPTTG